MDPAASGCAAANEWGCALVTWGNLNGITMRFADTVARQTRHETGASEQDIDIMFGWQEAFYSAKMQMHYETKLLREVRTCVTRLV